MTAAPPLPSFTPGAPPGGQQRVRYRYHFTDFQTGRLRATLPMRDVQLVDVLKGVGSAQGSISLFSQQARAQDLASATIPRRAVLWAERQVLDAQRTILSSKIMWGGPIMSRARSRAGRDLAIKAVSWEGYLARRLVTDASWAATNKVWIAQWLLANAFGGFPLAGSQFDPDNPWLRGAYPTAPIWNIPGLVYGASPDGYLAGTAAPQTGPSADRTYLFSDQKTALDALTQLGNSGDGFDWHLVPFRDAASGLLAVRAELAWPRLGRVAPPDLVWSSVRNSSRAGYVADYTITEDESATSNMVYAVGSGQPPDQLRSRATNFAEGDYGYPPYEGSVAVSSTEELTTQASVDGFAAGALATGYANAVKVTGAAVRGDLFPYLDTWSVGDDGALRVDDSLTGQPLTVVGQVIGRSIEPPQQGRSETVRFDLQGSVS